MSKVLLTENMWLPDWRESVGRMPLAEAQQDAEDVKSHGLSETEYIAVVPAELGTAGKVNGNGRIYPAPVFATENATLHTRAQTGFVGAESGHPESLPTFNVAARIVEVEVVNEAGEHIAQLEQNDDGAWFIPEDAVGSIPTVLHARGKLAFLQTESGRDLWCCYRAGMPLGTSSRSFGFPVPHKLEGESPYLEANPDHVGKTIDVIEGQELITYDIVTVPSAGTYIQGNAGAAAFNSLQEHAQTRRVDDSRGVDDMYDREWLRKNAPELFKALEEAEKVAKNPLFERLNGLSEAEQTRFGSLVDIVAGTGADKSGDDVLAGKIGAVVESQIGPLRNRLTIAEEALRKTNEQLEKANEENEKLKSEKLEREKAAAMSTALEGALEGVHKNIRESVAGFVRGSIDTGLINDPDAIPDEVKRVAELCAGISKATTESSPAPAGDDNSNSADPNADDGGDQPPADMDGTDIAAAALMGENWQSELTAHLPTRTTIND